MLAQYYYCIYANFCAIPRTVYYNYQNRFVNLKIMLGCNVDLSNIFFIILHAIIWFLCNFAKKFEIMQHFH